MEPERNVRVPWLKRSKSTQFEGAEGFRKSVFGGYLTRQRGCGVFCNEIINSYHSRSLIVSFRL
jgi:hypothetical protein